MPRTAGDSVAAKSSESFSRRHDDVVTKVRAHCLRARGPNRPRPSFASCYLRATAVTAAEIQESIKIYPPSAVRRVRGEGGRRSGEGHEFLMTPQRPFSFGSWLDGECQRVPMVSTRGSVKDARQMRAERRKRFCGDSRTRAEEKVPMGRKPRLNRQRSPRLVQVRERMHDARRLFTRSEGLRRHL
jgi:hypothetical protein